MKGVILQPTYLPWMGYFELIKSSDIYIIFDHVQFVKQSWQQRNKIKINDKIHMLTIPVYKQDKMLRICDVRIAYGNNESPLETHWKTIKSTYKKAPYFKDYEEIFEKIYSAKYTYIRDLNVSIIKEISRILNINTPTVYSSQLNLNDKHMNTEDKLINLCNKVGIDCLYEPEGGQAFLDVIPFNKNNINVEFQKFIHPTYNQLGKEFIPYISVIDLLFNEGNKSINVINEESLH